MSTTAHDAASIAERLARGGPPVLPWSECDPANAPDEPDLVEGLIPARGASLLVGRPKTGKSQFLGHLVACLVTGRPVFEHYEVADPENVRILWILTEETHYRPRRRVEANLRGFGLAPEEIEKVNERIETEERILVSADDPTAKRRLRHRRFSVGRHREWLEESARDEQLSVVVLDSLRAAHRRDENSSTEMQPVTRMIRNLAVPVCFIPVHHQGYGGEEGHRSGGAAARGSSDLDAARDTAIHLRNGEFGSTLLIEFDHRHASDRFVAVETLTEGDDETPTFRWKFLKEADNRQDVQHHRTRATVLRRIDEASAPGELPASSEIKDLIGDVYPQVLSQLEAEGLIERRELNSPGPGAPRKVVARPGQFSDDDWKEAEDG